VVGKLFLCHEKVNLYICIVMKGLRDVPTWVFILISFLLAVVSGWMFWKSFCQYSPLGSHYIAATALFSSVIAIVLFVFGVGAWLTRHEKRPK